MATITASNSIAYFVWPFGELTAIVTDDITEFPVISNNLTDGYRANVGVGFTAGVRSWKFTFPSLLSYDTNSPTVTDINGATVSREQCLRSLYAENKVNNTPFIYTDPVTSVNYFCDFADPQLSLARMRVKIYTTGLAIRQRRIPGVTV
jgi:hypothetical protein